MLVLVSLLCAIIYLLYNILTIGCSTTLITDNSAFTASSHAVGNEPWKARLEGNSWCSTVLTTSNYTLLPWIQVTLNTTYMIHYIGVAGYNKAGRFNDDYIANYHVLYGSVNDSQLQYVIEENESCPKVNHLIKLESNHNYGFYRFFQDTTMHGCNLHSYPLQS